MQDMQWHVWVSSGAEVLMSSAYDAEGNVNLGDSVEEAAQTLYRMLSWMITHQNQRFMPA